MKREIASTLLLGIFLFVALFGLPMMLSSHSGHHEHCPLQAAQAICERTIVEHFSIWQSMLASIVGTLTLLLSFAILVLQRSDGLLLAHERIRYRRISRTPQRPTLMQELFSRGIHNRKEPYGRYV